MIRPLWVISLLAAFAVNVIAYAYFPDTLNIFLVSSDTFSFFLGKQQFFWSTFIVILIINILFILLGKNIPALPKSAILVPQKRLWMLTLKNRKELYARLKEWFRGLAISVNLFFAALIANIYSLNSDIPSEVGWTIWLAAAFFGLFLLLYFPFFLAKPSEKTA